MSSYRPFCFSISLTAFALAAALLTPACPLHAQTAPQQPAQQAAALSDKPKSDAPAQKGLTGRAIDKVKEVAKSAGDIFSRVPCLPPKGEAHKMGSLPRVAGRLAAG